MSKSNAPAALEHFDRLPDSAFVDVYVVAGLLGVGRSTIWKWASENNPLIPQPRKFGRNTTFSVAETRKCIATSAESSKPS